MRIYSVARLTLMGAALGVCSSASAADATSQPSTKELRLTPFVLGEASSRAKRHAAPRTEKEALARKRIVRGGIIAFELPEDRMVNLVAVRRADGVMETMHEGQMSRSEVNE